MGVESISQTNQFTKVSQQVLPNKTTATTSIPATKPDTFERTTKNNQEKNSDLKKILLAIGGLAVIAGGIYLKKRLSIKPSVVNNVPTPTKPEQIIDKIFKQGNKVVEGVKLEKGINAKVTLPDGTLFNGTMERTDKFGRKIISEYEDGLVALKRLINSDGTQKLSKSIFRGEGNYIKTFTRPENISECFIKEFHYYDNGKLKYMRYGKNSMSIGYAYKGKFIGFDDKGKMVLKGQNGLANGNNYINFFDNNGKISRRMQMVKLPEEGSKCCEYIFDKNGKILKKSFAPLGTPNDGNGNLKYFVHYSKADDFINNTECIIMPQKFGNMKILPKATRKYGAGFALEYPNGDDVYVCIQDPRKMLGYEPEFLEISKIEPTLPKATHKTWDIPLSVDAQNTIECRHSATDTKELPAILKKVQEICEAVKSDKNFSLQSGGYNVLDVINERLIAMSK